MHWIQHGEKLKKGTDNPPKDNVYFVDEKGSMAIIGGKLYIDGIKAPKGKHKIKLDNTEIELEVTE